METNEMDHQLRERISLPQVLQRPILSPNESEVEVIIGEETVPSVTTEMREVHSRDNPDRPSAASRTTSELPLLATTQRGQRHGRHRRRFRAPPLILRSLFRSLRLNILWELLAKLTGRTNEEEAKIVFHKNRLRAAFCCVLHLIPVTISLVLIQVNISEYFVGYNIPWFHTSDNQQLAALQFAAKAHELLILASLSSIVMTAVRHQLAFSKQGVPYGTIFAGLDVGYLNTIWSMEFWAGLWNAKFSQWLLTMLIGVSCLLGAIAGPSSANLMIPRWRDWPAGGTTYWINATNEELFPTEINVDPNLKHCTSIFDDPACPYGGYEIIAESFMSAWANMVQLDNQPETIYLPSRQAERAMTFRDRSQTNGSETIWANAFTLATVNPAAIADGLSLTGFLWAFAVLHATDKRQWSRRDNAVFSVNTQQPLVMTYCNQYSAADFDENATMSFADLASEKIGSDFDGDDDTLHYKNVAVTNSTTLSVARQYVASSKKPGLLWLDDEELRARTGSTLNVIAAIPQSVLGHPTYYCCSIDTRYAPVTLTTATHSPKIVNGYPLGMETFGTYDPAWKRTYPSTEWARLVNPDFGQADSTAALKGSPFMELIKASGLWNNSNMAQGGYATYIVESAIASLLANGIGLCSYNMSMAGVLRGLNDTSNFSRGGEWVSELLPQKQMGFGGDAYYISSAKRDYAQKFTMHATASGYGYSWHGTAQLLALTVMSVYVMLALVSVGYSLFTGRYSGSWSTIGEITTLAWNTRAAAPMRNAGAGVRSMATFQEPVRVVVIDGHLELVRTGDASHDSQIQPNEAYV